MKKTVLLMFVLAIFASLFAGTACAETYYNQGFYVEFNGNAMNTNVTGTQLAETFSSLEPGDDAYFNITLVNNCNAETYWYMYNKARETLEEIRTSATGGNYTYQLTYTAQNGAVRVLYDSDRVGGGGSDADTNKYGEDSNSALWGLNQISSNLKDYFYLDTFGASQRGTITLHVALDGESIGNVYQNTQGVLQFQFAVEKPDSKKTTLYSDRPKTGDGGEVLLWSALLVISGMYFVMGKRMKKNRKSAAILVLCFILCSAFFTDTNACADPYKYKIKVYSGKITEFNWPSQEYAYGDEVNLNSYLDQAKARLGDESKYYVKGIRLSGRDNVQDDISPVVKVKQDSDYCISYGVKGNLTKYTIVYQTTGGTRLGAEEYYGNIGDKPVVAYRYFDGYNPRVLALTQTLKEDASQNVFTFQYTPVVVNTTTTVVDNGNTGTTGGTTGNAGNANTGNANADNAANQNGQDNTTANTAENTAETTTDGNAEGTAENVTGTTDDTTSGNNIISAVQPDEEAAPQVQQTSEPVVMTPVPVQTAPVPTYNPEVNNTAEPIPLVDLDDEAANAAFNIADVTVPLATLQERADMGSRAAKIAIALKYTGFGLLVVLLGGGLALIIARSNSKRALAAATRETQMRNTYNYNSSRIPVNYDPSVFNVDDLFNRGS